MDPLLLRDVGIEIALTVAALLACHRIGLPPLVGYLAAGVALGPHGFGLVGSAADVEIFAEVGVILLLFTIGLELSLGAMARSARLFLAGGTLQVLLTSAAGALAALAFGLPAREALFLGLLTALSSTAIALKALQERDSLAAPHGRAAVAVLVYQDLAAVPMLLAVPLLAAGGGSPAAVAYPLAKSALALALVALAALRLAPLLLERAARTRSRELFLLTAVALCLGTAVVVHELGIPLAVGSFLAGLVIAESRFSHQVLGLAVPFRDVFASFFFLSVGMLFDLPAFAAALGALTLAALAVAAGKAFLAALSLRLAGVHPRAALAAGFTLAQVGEFSFILAGAGASAGLLSPERRQIFLAVAVLTLGAAPFLIAASTRLAAILLPRARADEEGPGEGDGLAGHLVIVGYGHCGRVAARAARGAGVPLRILEMNAETVRRESGAEPALAYGDASDETVLDHAGVRRARALVIAISDNAAVAPVIAAARRLNPDLRIIARTRYVADACRARELGANDAVAEEFESAIEVAARTLAAWFTPAERIADFIAAERMAAGEPARASGRSRPDLGDLSPLLGGLSLERRLVRAGSPLAGRTLGEADLRRRHGVTLLALVRPLGRDAQPGRLDPPRGRRRTRAPRPSRRARGARPGGVTGRLRRAGVAAGGTIRSGSPQEIAESADEGMGDTVPGKGRPASAGALWRHVRSRSTSDRGSSRR